MIANSFKKCGRLAFGFGFWISLGSGFRLGISVGCFGIGVDGFGIGGCWLQLAFNGGIDGINRQRGVISN